MNENQALQFKSRITEYQQSEDYEEVGRSALTAGCIFNTAEQMSESDKFDKEFSDYYARLSEGSLE